MQHQDQQTAAIVQFTVAYEGTLIPFSLPATDTIESLRERLAERTGVPPQAQKLLYKGQIRDADKDGSPNTLASCRIVNGAKIMLVGSSKADISKLQETETKLKVMQQRRQLYAATSNASSGPRVRTLNDGDDFTFQSIQVLTSFKDHTKAQQLLERLRDDVGVREVMKVHKWSVGILKELHPAERTILGYNQNKGQVIALRLRTDDLDGFRHYDSVRKVLMHELAHMVWSEHDDNFHNLNRQLNAEVVKLDWSQKGKTLTGEAAVGEYDRETEEKVDVPQHVGGVFVLGGNREKSQETTMRELLAGAAIQRLAKNDGSSGEEQEEEASSSQFPEKKY
ncbi:hypothetical protein HK102_008789 [Quaeritorhiza haematococci]|nr:hypothetical protein HK102_008789 [Quaeritorhiza haematococci]